MSNQISYQQPRTIANKFIEQIHNIESDGVKKIVFDEKASLEELLNQGLPNEAASILQSLISTSTPVLETHLVRKKPELLEKAEKQIKVRNRFELDVENCSVLDLFVNLSTKKNVINTLKTLSNINYDNSNESIFYYTDIGLTFFFDEDSIITEIEANEKYLHPTTKGLKIGDSILKAIEIYGVPRMKSAKGAIWENFSVILRDKSDEISLIRLKKRTFK
ncbi:MAG: hypothetical protein KatS3mg068_1740 [Candidatus Sericytochromatia bacterium]|nr:MAG: hypothetical protein KatS3mg068_1740 [Candidatus Sericytochromatia bacterium]